MNQEELGAVRSTELELAGEVSQLNIPFRRRPRDGSSEDGASLPRRLELRVAGVFPHDPTVAPRRLAPPALVLFTSLATVPLAALLIGGSIPTPVLVLVCALWAATGAAAATLITRPLPPTPLAVIEGRLRVLTMATVATLVFALAAASLHGAVTVDPLGLGFCWLFMAALLRVVLGAASEQGRQSGLEVQSRHRDAGGLPAGALPHASLPTLCAFFKRTIDLVAALAVLPLALPIIAVAAVAITLDSEGGWLFRQTRLGRGGRPFQLLKLRTMVAVNDDMEHRACMAAHIGGSAIPGPPYGKVAADRRVTRVGRVLRRFSIDELPQLWNVIKGEMSLVGPRPPLPWEVELYDDRAIQRLDGKPGLTGLWQVQGRGDVPFSEMVSLDLHYLETWSPMADLRILARTPKAALWARNTA